MNKGIAKIAEQIDGYGIFGVVELECNITENHRQCSIIDDGANKEWNFAVLFGAKYFLDHIQRRVGLTIKIINIDSHAVDTNTIIISYLTIRALIAATGYSLKQDVTFDKNNKSFIFPK